MNSRPLYSWCMRLRVSLLLWAACCASTCWAAPVQAAAPAPSALDAVVRKLEAVRSASARGGVPRPVELNEAELGAYLNGALRLPRGVSGLGVRLDRDRLFASGTVDLEQVRQHLPPTATSGMLNPLAYLSGVVPAEFSLKLDTANGFGTVALESVSIGPVSVPVSVVEQVITRSTKNAENPEGVDVHAPFRLPYAIKRVRLQPGRAIVEF